MSENHRHRRPDARSAKQAAAANNSQREGKPSSSRGPEKNEALLLLVELFPNWSEEDLVSVLAEHNNDVELVCNRIADGHANQWTAAGKKPSKPAPAPEQRRGRNERRSEGAGAPPRKNQANEDLSTKNEDLSWGVTGQELSWGAPTVVEQNNAGTTVSAEECIVKEFSSITLVDNVKETTTSASSSKVYSSIKKTSPKEELVEQKLEEEIIVVAKFEEEASNLMINEVNSASILTVVEKEEEDDFVVRLPSMPARKQAALEIEPAAVLLPFSVPIKSGSTISFGGAPSSSIQAGNSRSNSSKVIFGESKSTPGVTTPMVQKVYSPEELFASATLRPSVSSNAGQQIYSTTSIEATSGSPPGLALPPKSPTSSSSASYAREQRDYDSHYQPHQSRNIHQQQQQQQQQQMPFYNQRSAYDTSYSQQHFAQRFASPYGAASQLDDAFGVPSASGYYPQNSRQATNAGGYYVHPHAPPQHHHHYGPQAMYGSDPYGASAFTAPQPTSRYHPGAASSASGNTGQHQQQQYHQSQPGASSSSSTRSRMF